ncbi:metallophosphoesterase domain-containing protein [Colletotrichum orchidophilum]|uniref:Metallophosphoesterase domain-containing protein n=1 Tax=Colletotrichum orchidophilum TaxID=1209926 RepID=A0A1G4BM89_9PEZI|nr:metallophosphoesterase domain-containing protein [Colletotrichum orchidophilum]OHF02445.1 metallophosphoesterase domain-containing protein [Colletotrichum orchidophilum]
MPLYRASSGLDDILNRPEDAIVDQLLSNPLSTIARYLNDFFPVSHPVVYVDDDDDAVTVVCISDTHNTQPRLPPGDILVHAGDLTASGTEKELQETLDWLKKQPHRYKVVVAGNHDLCLDEKYRRTHGTGNGFRIDGLSKGDEDLPTTHRDDDDGGSDGPPPLLDWGDIIYLNRTSTTLTLPHRRRNDESKTYSDREVRVYGSPYTPRHGTWAFQYPRSASAPRPNDVDDDDDDPWRGAVPAGTDILVTHAPPKGHMDDPRGNWGCEMLLREVWRARPRLHVFGHVHCGHGREAVAFDGLQAAYENVVLLEALAMAGGGGSDGGFRGVGGAVTAGARAILALGWCFWAWVWLLWWRGGRRGAGRTVFVNAAAVGGIRDRLVREAIVVRI